MKHPLLLVLVLASVAGLYSPGARADATMSFKINDRSPKVPVARVRWSYALASAPGAATSVTITEGASPGVVAALGDGFHNLPSGDRFRLDAAPTLTNGVTFLYEARSHFTAPNFCIFKAGFPPVSPPAPPTFPKTVTLTFTGPQITQHALGAYTVAGVDAASTLFCQQSKRRASDGVVVGAPPPAPAPATALRLPLDVLLVLDKSGSMGWELPGSPINSAPSRWTVLGTALDQFVALWEQASEAGVTGDRLGLVHFDTAAAPADFGAGSIFKSRGAWATLLTQAKSPIPGGSTAIGAGINTAITKWTADPANFDAVMILMTDGEQNVAPEIAKIDGTDDWALGPVGAPVAGTDELYRKGLAIQTIGFGTPLTLQADLLGGIAEQTAGTSIITASSTGLSAAMQDTLVQALKGNTLGMLARTTGTLTPPALLSAPIPLQVDASASRVTLVLDWTGRRGLFDLLLQPPGGGTPIVPTVRTVGANWIVASIDLPANGPSGVWNAFVRGNDVGSPTGFSLSAYAVDGRLKYSLNFGRDPSGTGDAIPLMVEVVYDGVPLSGIAGGIRLSPAAPAEGAGNILHAAGAGPAPVVDQNATTAKVLQLARDANLLGRTQPKPTGEQLVLLDNGSGGDAAAGDAVYTTRVVGTRVPGRYRFDVVLEWDDPRTGKVRRVESIERTVQPLATEGQTVVVIAQPVPGGNYQLQVTPRDRFGNYVGPGYGKLVRVKLNGTGSVGPVTDPAETGDYTVQVSGVVPGSTPTVDIVVDGKPVRTGQPLVPGTTGGGAGGSGKYAIWGGIGVAIPGNFSNVNKSDWAGTLGFEALLTPSLSAEATLGTHRFDGKSANPDVRATVFGVDGKWYFTAQPARFFATAGVGAYDFHPGSTRFGGTVGVGAQFRLTPQWSLEGRYNLHGVVSNAPYSSYSTLLLAARYAF
jgi:hypothetical protein